MLEARQLSYGTHRRELLHSVDLTVRNGELHAVLGPNGAGKSLLLRNLAGELSPDAGEIRLLDQPLQTWDAGALARQRAVLPQSSGLRFDFSVRQVVALGRLPWEDAPAAENRRAVERALRLCGLRTQSRRRYPTLSGGERARVQLARVIAQISARADDCSRFLLLDEPLASLDIRHQHACMRLLKKLARHGAGVLVVVHDPNFALRYADRVSLMQAGRVVFCGPSHDVLTAENLSAIYGIAAQRHPGQQAFIQMG